MINRMCIIAVTLLVIVSLGWTKEIILEGQFQLVPTNVEIKLNGESHVNDQQVFPLQNTYIDSFERGSLAPWTSSGQANWGIRDTLDTYGPQTCAVSGYRYPGHPHIDTVSYPCSGANPGLCRIERTYGEHFLYLPAHHSSHRRSHLRTPYLPLCPRGQGSRCTGGYGGRGTSRRPYTAAGGGDQVTGVSALHWNRGIDRPGGSHCSNRFGHRIHHRSGIESIRGSNAGLGWMWCCRRYCRDLQCANRGLHVCSGDYSW